jgi:hypothetical protein
VPWARFEDDYLGNTKLATLSTAAIALDMAAIIYSARELRDGVLSEPDVQAVAALIHLKRWPPTAAELVRVNRWAKADGGGFTIHDYLEYQPSRQQVLEERAAAAQRMRRVRGKSGGSSPERSPELREKFNDPVPGPGPGPERSYQNVLVTSPQPPPQAAGEAPPSGAQNGATVDLAPRVRSTVAEPEPACCPNFAATGSEHWQYCPNAPAEVTA